MSEDQIIHPKVFISYSWAIQDKVKELADRLIHDGINVIIDIYDLQSGNDKYAFMEQQVTDSTIDHVLVICDKTYAEKADRRIGGVGDETAIITPEIYGKIKQTKFIPVVFEKDSNNTPYCPAYIKRNIYVDLSVEESFELEYENLLRDLYNMPSSKKPELGERPKWIDNNNVDLSKARTILKQIKDLHDNNNAIDILSRTAIYTFIETARQYSITSSADVPSSLITLIAHTKLFRDCFVDFCITLLENGCEADKIITLFFESFYNELTKPVKPGEPIPSNDLYTQANIELIEFITWELFIDMTALLLFFNRYDLLYRILNHSYYVRSTPCCDGLVYKSYTFFSKSFATIEGKCKPISTNPNLLSLAADIITGREWPPFLTMESISNADIVLHQMSTILFCKQINVFRGNSWFPYCYVYHKRTQSIWRKLESVNYCIEMAPLFGVKTVNEIKAKVLDEASRTSAKYSKAQYPVPKIIFSINLTEIGTLP